MKIRYIPALALAFAILGACAYSPEKVALDYWTKKARLDPACSDQMESRYRRDVRREVQDARTRMAAFYPGLDRFGYDFSGLSAQVANQTDYSARVRISGKASASDPSGAYRDEVAVDEVLDLKMEYRNWVIDGGWRLDQVVRAALNDLAGAQTRHFERHQAYASRPEQLAEWFKAPDGLSVSIIEADRSRWRAMAFHRDGRRAFVYDSGAGGIIGEPIPVAP